MIFCCLKHYFIKRKCEIYVVFPLYSGLGWQGLRLCFCQTPDLCHSLNPPPPRPPFLKVVGIDLTKNSKKVEMEKLKVRGILRRGDSVGNGGAVSWGIFSSWCVANVLIFNYILVIVFPFPSNVDVSPCFHCTVLVPVYRVYTSSFHDTVVSFCYRLHTSCLRYASVTSCFSLNIWF